MDNSLNREATMSVLPLDCLCEIFKYVPVLERMRFREVCKQWRSAVDHCWMSIRALHIDDKVDDASLETTISATRTTLDISTRNAALANGLIDCCGQFLRSLQVEKNNYFSGLPQSMRRCRQLEELEMYVKMESEDRLLCTLLQLNPKIIHLHLWVTVQDNYRYRFFEHIPKSTVEQLALRLSPPVTEINSYAELLQYRGSFLSMYGGIMGQVEDTVREAPALKHLVVNYVPQMLLRVVGERTNLEELVLGPTEMDDLYAFPATDEVPTKWHYLCNLRNLRALHVHAVRAHPFLLKGTNPHQQMVTDDFVEELVRRCPLLEEISLCDCVRLTDRSVHALTSLRLKQLDLGNTIPLVTITDRYLVHFVNIEELDLEGQFGVKDSGIVELLQKNETIRELNLKSTDVTRETLVAAVEATKRRTSDVKLNVYFSDSRDFSDVENTSLLLNVQYLTTRNNYHLRALLIGITEFMESLVNAR